MTRTRRTARGADTQPATRPGTRPGGKSTPPAPRSAGRAGRLGRPAPSGWQGLLGGRARLILGAAGVIVFAAIVLVLYLGASAPAYACDSLTTPSASPSPGASGSPGPLGQPQDDMGRSHVSPGTTVRYLACPPASGSHYNAAGIGPIQPRFYGKDDSTVPEGWIHNLEHGGIVILYRCAAGDSGCTDATQQQLQQLAQGFPASPVCKIPAGTDVAPVVTRFDQMSTPFAALVWDRVLLLQTLDTSAILGFYNAEAERENPEPQCSNAGASPGMTLPPLGSPSPSGS